jgi:effector-binding domain-containing protein
MGKMPRISEIVLLKTNEQPTMVVRTTTKVEKLPLVIGDSYRRIAEYLKELDELCADVPFVAYHNMDMQNLDVEIGFPVAKALPEKGDIKPGLIPAGKVVFCMYRGAYSNMAPVYGEMVKWITDNGHRPTGTCYEHYYNSPGVPESELLTKIVMPLE